jgi:uncharacterized protein YcbX
MNIVVSALYCYPIKGCKGHALTEAQTEARGIAGDRSLMIVDAGNEFISQRDMPKLALIAPTIRGDTVTLTAPGMPALTFTPTNEGRQVRARVWNDVCDAVDQGNDVSLWLQDFLAAPVRMVRMADAFQRKCDPKYARSEHDQTSFSDGYPFLLISQASLDDLNAKLSEPVPMNRFRPNIVVSGCEPFAEDTWRDIHIAGVDFGVVKPCARCNVPTIDQDTAIAGHEPIKTLAAYRTVNQKVMFGQNLIASNAGVLRVGDEVVIGHQ